MFSAESDRNALLKSHTDDDKVRGGARLPRRSLCNDFILLILKTFTTFCMFFLPGAALKRTSTTTGFSVDRRDNSAYGHIKSGSRRNARWCLHSTGWEPHKWLMHPRSLHPPVCCRCGVSTRGERAACLIINREFLNSMYSWWPTYTHLTV